MTFFDFSIASNAAAIGDSAPSTGADESTAVGMVLQGPGGIKGDPGAGATDALQIAARLSEFNTPEAKAAARANLELETLDGGTFF